MMTREFREVVARFRSGAIDRRAFLKAASTAGVSLGVAGMLADGALADEATPVAGESIRSMTRDEYIARIRETFSFEDAEADGGQLILASTTDIKTLNPVVRADVIALYAINNIYSYLARQSPIDGTMAPDLADYWDLAPDGKTYTFYINADAIWHDGEPVTAHDCLMTFEAVMAEESMSPVGSEFVQNIASMRAIDDKTFELVAKEPAALVLEKTVATMAILPMHIWGDIPFGEWATSPGSTGSDPTQVVGSGPFVFREWVLGDHVTIDRNEDYWLPEQVPHIDSFTIRAIADPNSAIQSVVAGDTDTMRGMAPTQISMVEGRDDIRIETYDDMGWGFFLMNADAERNPFFSDTRVRQALMYAVDRELIVDTMLAGVGTPAVGVQPPTSPAYAPDQVTTVYTYDPDKARELLDEAGWVEGSDGVREKDGVRFSVEFLYGDDMSLNDQLVPYLKQVFGDVGVEIEPKSMPSPTMMDSVIGGTYEMATLRIFWTLDDQGVLYRCDAIPPAGFNLTRHCNEEFDRLNTASQMELDPEKRLQLMIDQGNIANDEAYWGILYFNESVVPVNTRVRNAFFSAFGDLWSMTDIWLAE